MKNAHPKDPTRTGAGLIFTPPLRAMNSHLPEESYAVRLYGGADDSGILYLPFLEGQKPIALALSTGVYVAAGIEDSTGLALFALVGTESSLWLGSPHPGGEEPPTWA